MDFFRALRMRLLYGGLKMKRTAFRWSILGFCFVLGLGALSFSLAFGDPTPSGSGSDQVSWHRTPFEINSLNSNFKLTIPVVSSNNEVIVGISPTEAGEAEEIAVGVVTWEDSGLTNRLVLPRISGISNYPVGNLQSSPGDLSVIYDENLFQADQSLVVYLKVNQGTTVKVEQDEKVLAEQSVTEGFVIQNGLPLSMKKVRPTGLLVQLQTSRLARAFGKGE